MFFDEWTGPSIERDTIGILKISCNTWSVERFGVDLIVFTGGIGENNSRMRRRVCENLSYLGVKFDYEANVATGKDVMISLPDSGVKVAVITTNEELVIAQDTMHIVMNEQENN